MSKKDPVVIVGAGVAGLCCAMDLKAQGVPVLILEREDAIGGRVRTDDVKGFRLDRGFQVWLEAYPECRKRLDPQTLQAGAFGSGAIIFDGKDLRLFADPLRHPGKAFGSLLHPSGSLSDKLRMQILRSRLSRKNLSELLGGEEGSTLEYWEKLGFSPQIIRSFLSPFFRGIFLADPGEVSRRMFDFVFSMFGQGRALLPAGGIQAIPDALAKNLTDAELRLSVTVGRVEANRLWTEAGDEIAASAVVVTVPDPHLLGLRESLPGYTHRSVRCCYFQSVKPPIQGPWLVLNGSGFGNITQVAVNSSVTGGLAPEGRHLISVSMNEDSDLSEKDTESVKNELVEWFGEQVKEWELLKDFHIGYALPAFPPGDIPGPGWREEQGIFVCGDGCSHPSLQGAMSSGAAVASELLRRGLLLDLFE